MTDSQMLSIIESTDEELSAAETQLGELAGDVFDGLYEPGLYSRLVRAGNFQASTVRVEGEPKFVLIHTRTPLGWLTVEGVAALRPCSVKLIYDAVDALARKLDCKVIQVVTKLSGMFRMALRSGYHTTGIILFKNAPAT